MLVLPGIVWIGNPVVLVGLPLMLLVLFHPPRTPLSLALGALGLATLALGDVSSGLWYLERGWALLLGGCFLAVSLRWPGDRFLPRGMGAVVAAFATTALLFRVRHGEWSVVDWLVRDRMEQIMSTVLQAVRVGIGPEAVPADLEARALQTVALQGLVFPALLGLASLSSLGFAWWVFKKASRSQEAPLRPLREFRFNDQLVWVLLLGFVALVATSGAGERIGANAVVFMGALYALRGAAVVLFLSGGLSSLATVVLVTGFFVLTLFVPFVAIFIGLGDTWFDLRNRRPRPRPEG